MNIGTLSKDLGFFGKDEIPPLTPFGRDDTMTDLTKFILKDCYSKSEALGKLHQISQMGVKKMLSDDVGSIKELTAKNFDDMVEESEKEIKEMAVLTVYVPIDLANSEVDHLGETMRETFKKDFLIDFRVDPKLIAGAAIAWNGKYRDFSIRKKLEEKQGEIRKLVLN